MSTSLEPRSAAPPGIRDEPGNITPVEWASIMRDVGQAFDRPADEDYLHALRKVIDPLSTIRASDVDKTFARFMNHQSRRPTPAEVVQVLRDVDEGRRAARRQAREERADTRAVAEGRPRRAPAEHGLLWWAVWVALDVPARSPAAPAWLAPFVKLAQQHDVRPEHGIPGEPGYNPRKVTEALDVVRRLHARLPEREEREHAVIGAALAMAAGSVQARPMAKAA